jgi:hypothetical protein
MKQKIFLWLLLVLLLVGGRSMLSSFMVNHQYYNTMFSSMANWWMIIWAIAAAIIPVGYIIYSKKITIKYLAISLLLWLLVFGAAFVGVKGDLTGAGLILLMINITILFALGIYSMVAWTAAGSWLVRRLFWLDLSKWQNMFLAFWMGMSATMLIVHFLVVANIFYPLLTWLLFIAGWVAIWYEKQRSLATYSTIITDGLAMFRLDALRKNTRIWVGVWLLLLSVIYFYYGFQLSFIPYSTAWDANHAYMYIPKVRAENAGALGWGQPGGAGWSLWLSYIAFFFSLIQPIKSRFWLSADNIGVSMNFLSGLFVLIFGIGLVKEFVWYVYSTLKHKKDTFMETLGLYAGWACLLLWITSGMGAFLVFVDNKTDMGLLAMTTLALLSWIIFVRYIHEHKTKKEQTTINKYIVLSGIFFALAVASKPTAFIDVIMFVLFLTGLWINAGVGIWLGVIVLALLSKLQILYTREFLSADAFLPLLLVGVIVLGVSIFVAMKQHKDFVARVRYSFGTLLRWWVTAAIVVLVVKWPYLLIAGIQSGDLSPANFVQWILMGQRQDASSVLLTQSDTVDSMQAQNSIDRQQAIDPAMCSLETLWWTDADLDKDLRTFQGWDGLSEDVGRYVGFGWKQFSSWLGYRIARAFMPRVGGCYGWDKTAKMLCQHEDAINNFDLAILYDLVEELAKNSVWYTLVADALGGEKIESMLASNSFNPAQMRDEIVAIRQWYQARSFKTLDNSLMVPYRYIVPWNAVFNRSLQNLSSYYTDIGFVRWVLILLQIMALIYAVIVWNHRLLLVSGITFVGWAIWWLIAGGIVWYGIGLIVWSTLATVIFLMVLFDHNKDEQEKTLSIFVVSAIGMWVVIQLMMNLIRISSQGGAGPFAWYKMSAGMATILDENLMQQQILTIPYRWDDVFNLQFPHYNAFINHVKDRPDEHWVSIAGTYLQYFLHNQRNLWQANIYELTSDGNTCKSYLRLQRDNWKYLVIDPNILSIVMGEWNESLMHRFFARRDPVTGRIQEDGEMTMLVRMWYDGYLTLLSTNNIGAKYAFLLSDDELSAAFSINTIDELVFLRAKMGVARFFPDGQEIINFIASVFMNRLSNGQAIGDIADIFGKIIDENATLWAVQQVLNAQGNQQQIQEAIAVLTQDERFVAAQYLGLYNLLRQNDPQFSGIFNNIVSQGVAWGSQLIVFELQ